MHRAPCLAAGSSRRQEGAQVSPDLDRCGRPERWVIKVDNVCSRAAAGSATAVRFKGESRCTCVGGRRGSTHTCRRTHCPPAAATELAACRPARHVCQLRKRDGSWCALSGTRARCGPQPLLTHLGAGAQAAGWGGGVLEQAGPWAGCIALEHDVGHLRGRCQAGRRLVRAAVGEAGSHTPHSQPPHLSLLARQPPCCRCNAAEQGQREHQRRSAECAAASRGRRLRQREARRRSRAHDDCAPHPPRCRHACGVRRSSCFAKAVFGRLTGASPARSAPCSEILRRCACTTQTQRRDMKSSRRATMSRTAALVLLIVVAVMAPISRAAAPTRRLRQATAVSTAKSGATGGGSSTVTSNASEWAWSGEHAPHVRRRRPPLRHTNALSAQVPFPPGALPWPW